MLLWRIEQRVDLSDTGEIQLRVQRLRSGHLLGAGKFRATAAFEAEVTDASCDAAHRGPRRHAALAGGGPHRRVLQRIDAGTSNIH